MTDGGKLISLFGAFLVGLCFLAAIYMFVQEFMARAALPPELRTPEMIQHHFDGEVQLLSLTFGYLLLFVGVVLSGFFSICWVIYESLFGKR